MKILIDNGYGAETPGKRSPDGTLREYRFAREIADRVVHELRRRGHDAERCRRVNAACGRLGKGNVLLVSVHLNAARNGTVWMNARGWSAHVSLNASANSKELARRLIGAAEREGLKVRRYSQAAPWWPQDLAESSSRRDSVRIETAVRTEYVPDTVFIEIPMESERVTVRDTASHLETSYAVSDARLNTDGSLHRVQEKSIVGIQVVRMKSVSPFPKKRVEKDVFGHHLLPHPVNLALDIRSRSILFLIVIIGSDAGEQRPEGLFPVFVRQSAAYPLQVLIQPFSIILVIPYLSRYFSMRGYGEREQNAQLFHGKGAFHGGDGAYLELAERVRGGQPVSIA